MNDLDQTPLEGRAGKKDADDEISLIDLLVVLLKYRRLIITVVILGIIVSAVFYAIRAGKGGQTAEEQYEGRMTVIINPRLGKSGADVFPGWFNSRELIALSVKDAGLDEEAVSALDVAYNRNDGVDIYVKPGTGDREQIEKLFSQLLENAEILAVAVYYGRYAEDIISYVESGQADVSDIDYIRYRWARDFLSGSDTALKVLYPPAVQLVESAGDGSSPLTAVIIIVFASFFLAVFLAFAINALKNIGADGEAMAKIRGALGKKDGKS
ncbi:MAG: hypothetical protein LBR93_08790 [Treponema sp.]|jgi:hypothetical protein|nr:hypothetical protein [Treponema sp.]